MYKYGKRFILFIYLLIYLFIVGGGAIFNKTMNPLVLVACNTIDGNEREWNSCSVKHLQKKKNVG